MDAGVFVGIEKYIIGGLQDATIGLMMKYSNMITGLFTGLATIYIMWKGYQSLAGKLSTPMEDMMWGAFRILCHDKNITA